MEKRIGHLDVFRGIGIILMVLGHIGFGKNFDYYIHAFHMPMFFWISGYLFNTNKEKSLIMQVKKKAKSLLVPYVGFGLFHCFIWIIFKNISNKNWYLPLQNLLWINTENLPIAGALWFLTSLFFVDIIFAFLESKIKKRYILAIFITSIAIGGCFFSQIFYFRLPWALDTSFVGIGLYGIGYMTKELITNKIIINIFNMKYYEWIFCVIVNVTLIFYNGYINMRTSSYGNVVLFWLNAITAIILIWNLSFAIYRKIDSSIFLTISGRWLINVGKHSITYLCLNQIIIVFIKKISPYFDRGLQKIIIFIFVMFSLYIINGIIMNSKIKYFVGK